MDRSYEEQKEYVKYKKPRTLQVLVCGAIVSRPDAGNGPSMYTYN